MKKILIALILIGIVAGATFWYCYYRLLPELVGKAIVSNENPTVLPEPYKEKIQKFRKPVNKATERIIREIDSTDIPFSAILRLIDNTENDAVVRTYQELKAEDPQDPDQVFDIIKKNIPSEEFDLERFRKSFLRFATMERYEYGMRYIENNEIIEQIDEMPYRQIAKEVLLQKRAEIDKRLKATGGPKLN